MSISTKRIERISKKYDVPITLAPESADTFIARGGRVPAPINSLKN